MYFKNILNTSKAEADLEYGDGEAIELLNSSFYEIIKITNLEPSEVRELAELVSEREKLYEEITEDNIVDVDLTFLHKQRLKRLKNYPTNGKEYL